MTLNGHTDWVESVAFGEGNVLASGSYDNSVKIWNAVRVRVRVIIYFPLRMLHSQPSQYAHSKSMDIL